MGSAYRIYLQSSREPSSRSRQTRFATKPLQRRTERWCRSVGGVGMARSVGWRTARPAQFRLVLDVLVDHFRDGPLGGRRPGFGWLVRQSGIDPVVLRCVRWSDEMD